MRQYAAADTKQTEPVDRHLLLRCGLMQTVCNNRPAALRKQNTDGVLTGLEIISTNLRGPRQAVLPACETGVGEIRSREGVVGLRQAQNRWSFPSSLWSTPNQ